MLETTFQITKWEDPDVLALGYRRYGGGRERTWYAVPSSASNPAMALSTLLAGDTMTSQSWTAFDNSNARLHDGTLDSFAAWAAEVAKSAVVVYEVDGVTGGRWPGNPNVVAKWFRNPMKRNGAMQAVRYSAVEDGHFGYAVAEPTYDAYPMQRVVVLYALPVSSGRPAPYPVEIPLEGAAHPLQVGAAATDFIEPTYKDALYAVDGMSYTAAALQYHFEGQWVQRFALSQPYGVLWGKTSDTQGVWTDVAPPFDGLGAPPVLGFLITNLMAGNLSVRFGPGAPAYGEPIAQDQGRKYGATHGLSDGKPVVFTPSNRLQVSADAASLSYRIEYWFAPQGTGGCGCGG